MGFTYATFRQVRAWLMGDMRTIIMNCPQLSALSLIHPHLTLSLSSAKSGSECACRCSQINFEHEHMLGIVLLNSQWGGRGRQAQTITICSPSLVWQINSYFKNRFCLQCLNVEECTWSIMRHLEWKCWSMQYNYLGWWCYHWSLVSRNTGSRCVHRRQCGHGDGWHEWCCSGCSIRCICWHRSCWGPRWWMYWIWHISTEIRAWAELPIVHTCWHILYSAE